MKRLLLVPALLLCFPVFSWEGKKSVNTRYRAIKQLSDSGLLANPGLARHMPAEHFVPWYLQRGREWDSKKYGHEWLDSIGNDGVYAYYASKTSFAALDLIKVELDGIRGIPISGLDGAAIRKRFFAEIVTGADRDKARGPYSGANDPEAFSYRFDPGTGVLFITCKLEVYRGIGAARYRIYNAALDLKSGTLRESEIARVQLGG